MSQVNGEMIGELEGLETALESGRLAVVRYFMENRDNPQLLPPIYMRMRFCPHHSG